MQRSLPDETRADDDDIGAAMLAAGGGGSSPGFRPATRTKSAAASSNSTTATATIAYSGFHRFMVATALPVWCYSARAPPVRKKEAPSGASVSWCEMLSYFG